MVVGHTHSIVDQFFHAPAVLPLPDLPPRPPLIVTNRSSVKVFLFSSSLYLVFDVARWYAAERHNRLERKEVASPEEDKDDEEDEDEDENEDEEEDEEVIAHQFAVEREDLVAF